MVMRAMYEQGGFLRSRPKNTESKYELYNLRGFNIIYNSDPQNLSPCSVSSIICAKCPFKSTVLLDCLATWGVGISYVENMYKNIDVCSEQ